MKKISAISLSFILATSSLAANPFIPRFLQEKHHQSKSKIFEKREIRSNDEYVDFSGHWIGSCDDYPNAKEEIKIEYDSYFSVISIDDTIYQIDTISTQGTHGTIEAENSTSHIRWSPDGQELLVTNMSYYKEGNMAKGGLESIVGKSTFSVKNAQLLINHDLTIFTDGTFGRTVSVHCIYNKDDEQEPEYKDS